MMVNDTETEEVELESSKKTFYAILDELNKIGRHNVKIMLGDLKKKFAHKENFS